MSNKANDTIQYIYKLTVYSADVEELEKLINNLDEFNHSYELTKEIVTESNLLKAKLATDYKKKSANKKPTKTWHEILRETKTWDEMMADFGLRDPDWKPDTTDF